MGIRLTVRSAWSAEGGTEPCVYEFDQERVVIGRSTGTDVQLPHQAVSGTHATIRARGAGWIVQDEGSTNGTRVNGTAIPPGRPKPLRTGDVITLGGFAIAVDLAVPVAEATSVDRTSALARRLVRQLLDPEGTAPPPRLLVLNGPDEGRVLEIPEPPVRLLVGRGEGCDLALSDADASREHAEIERDLDGVVIRDLGSKNGVLVNDRRVRERRLRDRDELLVGSTVLVYEDAAESMLREVSAEPDAAMETPDLPEMQPAAEARAGEISDQAKRGEGAAGVPPAVAASEPGATAPAELPGRAPGRSGTGADLIIYVLAGAVLALSIAGLVVLLQAE